jgi:hypothetical protein
MFRVKPVGVGTTACTSLALKPTTAATPRLRRHAN